MATVLRMKRKSQKTPSKILLVVSKSKPINEGSKRKEPMNVDKKLFYFAFTIPINSPINEEVRERVRQVMSAHQRNSSTSFKSDKYPLRKKKTSSSLKDCLKTMGFSRGQQTTEKSLYARPQSLNRCRSSSMTATLSSHAQSSPINRCFLGVHQRNRKCTAESSQPDIQRRKLDDVPKKNSKEFSSSINRAKFNHKSGSKKSYQLEDEYVYDLYYSKSTGSWNVKDILYVKPLSYEELTSKDNSTTSKHRSYTRRERSISTNDVIKTKREAVEVDEDSPDEDEQGFIIDEEEDFYDSDDYDIGGRDDDDAFSTFFDRTLDDYGGGDEYVDYQDNETNDISYDDVLDCVQDVNADDYNCNDPGSY